MSTTEAVRVGIRDLPRGKPFTSAHFLKHGARGSVDRALSRLVREGYIQRVSRGVFVRPRTSRFVGTVLPDVLEVIEAIVCRTGETVQIHGAEAARRLRLSTQVPTAPVFLTSASSRAIRVGNITVKMIHTSSRRRDDRPCPVCPLVSGQRQRDSRDGRRDQVRAEPDGIREAEIGRYAGVDDNGTSSLRSQ